MGPGGANTSEGVLANFFNSLLNKKTGQGMAGTETVLLAERGRTVPRGPDKDLGRMDQGGEEARLVLRGPMVGQDQMGRGRMARGRMDLGRTGLGQMGRHGEESLEWATSHLERPSCSKG